MTIVIQATKDPHKRMEKITKTDLGTRLHMHFRRSEYSVLDFVADFSTTIWTPVKKINTKICSAQLSNIDPISLIGNTFSFTSLYFSSKTILICLVNSRVTFVQIIICLVSLFAYGLAPIGFSYTMKKGLATTINLEKQYISYPVKRKNKTIKINIFESIHS